MYEICNFMRGFTSRSFIFDATVTLRVAMKNGRNPAIICMFLFTTQRISLISEIAEQDEILCKKLHISYIDQFVVPPLFNGLIRAKDVDVEGWQAGHPWIHG